MLGACAATSSSRAALRTARLARHSQRQSARHAWAGHLSMPAAGSSVCGYRPRRSGGVAFASSQNKPPWQRQIEDELSVQRGTKGASQKQDALKKELKRLRAQMKASSAAMEQRLTNIEMLLKEKQAASSPRKCGADAANARDGRVSRADGTVAGQLLIQTAVAWMAGDGGQIVFWPVVTFLGAAYFITATYVGYQIFGLFFPAVSS
ncbi:hypothetical protein D9Q98_009123 [Chlorella vulgaris]|uniref:Uncharacterized protein n=1 Tax=Chlorella vulgaris TaxID=3077 RepID=A0A9D4TH78_CHLVU|nr:hypothetical protein D9Q98_009123 [Chlorella vulgaris]